MQDTRAKFEAALKKRKEEKVKEASRGSYGSYPDIPYAALATDRQRLFRFAGLPYCVREKSTDSKRIHVAMILGDDDKKFRCIGPDPKEHKDWILYRIMSKVLDRYWDKNIPGRNGQMGGYVYKNATLHPELYTRVAKNNNVNNPYESGWRFNPYILFNVIDREDYAWHTSNKKYRILSKKASEGGDRVYFDPGVPDTVYQQILDDIVAVDGNTNWEDYDIAIKRIPEKPWYRVYHAIDDTKKLDEGIRNFVVPTGLTDEERSWELNDFDKLYPITSYARIKAKLGLFIQKVDTVLGTHYYDELNSLVDKEESESTQSPVTTVATQQPAVSTPTAPVQSLSEPMLKPAVRIGIPPAPVLPQGAIPMTPAIWGELSCGTRKWRDEPFRGIKDMSNEEKALVIGIKADNQFVWRDDAGELFESSKSGFLSPDSVHVDPASGDIFGQTASGDIPF